MVLLKLCLPPPPHNQVLLARTSQVPCTSRVPWLGAGTQQHFQPSEHGGEEKGSVSNKATLFEEEHSFSWP